MFKINKLCIPGRYGLFRIPYISYSSVQNHYDVLKVPKDATNEEIKNAYYQQSKQYHPDLQYGNQEKFREINSAYEILGNPRLRKMYDKGLLSEGTSVIYESDSCSDSAPSAASQTPLSSENVNIWAKEQCSEAFEREKNRRFFRERAEDLKVRKSESRGAEGVIWAMLAIICLGVGFLKGGKSFMEIKKDPKKT